MNYVTSIDRYVTSWRLKAPTYVIYLRLADMTNTKPTYTTREINSIIKDCLQLKELDEIKAHLLEEINRYTPSDQAFLLCTLGITMMKMADPQQGSWMLDRLAVYRQKEAC